MTGKSIEITYADLVKAGAGPAAGAAAGPAGPAGPAALANIGAQTGGDFMNSLQGMMDQANSLISNFKDLVSMIKGGGLFSAGPAAGPAGPAGVNVYAPQPSLQQQLHRVVNVCYTAYGDITIAELLQQILNQYGGNKLSTLLKALEGGK